MISVYCNSIINIVYSLPVKRKVHQKKYLIKDSKLYYPNEGTQIIISTKVIVISQ